MEHVDQCAIEKSSEFDNLSEAEYLERIRGPKYLPFDLVLPIAIVYIMIFITGVFGNILTCVVIKRNPSMHTGVNFYLFNLAISDLLLLVLGVPNELSVFWEQYPWRLGAEMCKIRAYISEMSSYVSVLTIATLAWERYQAICEPLYLYAVSGPNRAIGFIAAAWVIALICAFPFAVSTKVNYLMYPPSSMNISADSAFCGMLPCDMPTLPLYQFSCLVFFLLPLIFIAVLYTRMGLRIQSNSIEHSSVHGETRQAQSRKSILRILSAVVITFFLCWAPFHAQRLSVVYNIPGLKEINEWFFPLTGCLYFFSATVNPILYSVMSEKYRTAFKETLGLSPNNSVINREDLSSARAALNKSGSQVPRLREEKETATPSCSGLNTIACKPKTPARKEPKKAAVVVHAGGRPQSQTSAKVDGHPAAKPNV